MISMGVVQGYVSKVGEGRRKYNMWVYGIRFYHSLNVELFDNKIKQTFS